MRARLVSTFRRALARDEGLVLILLYHRIAETSYDAWDLCVSPMHFEQHLTVLRNCGFSFASLDSIDQPPRRSIDGRRAVITFDDGYGDNFTNARLILEAHQVPATFFVVSGAVDQQEEFWWDHLERLVLESSNMPPALECIVSDRRFRWELDDALRANEGERRVALYRDLWTFLSRRSATARSSALEQFAEQIGDPPPRADYLPMTCDQLRSLARNPLFKVGAHTVTHPMLADLSVEEQRTEIEGSKRILEEILEEPIDAFSCPHGSYSAETVTILDSAGMRFACTSRCQVVDTHIDVLQLPRFAVENWDKEQFETRLASWVG